MRVNRGVDGCGEEAREGGDGVYLAIVGQAIVPIQRTRDLVQSNKASRRDLNLRHKRRQDTDDQGHLKNKRKGPARSRSAKTGKRPKLEGITHVLAKFG